MYEIEFSKEAAKHVLLLRKSSPQLFKKLERLLDELKEHPYTGTGHPEQLKYLQGVWSRQPSSVSMVSLRSDLRLQSEVR